MLKPRPFRQRVSNCRRRVTGSDLELGFWAEPGLSQTHPEIRCLFAIPRVGPLIVGRPAIEIRYRLPPCNRQGRSVDEEMFQNIATHGCGAWSVEIPLSPHHSRVQSPREVAIA
jgi:hypothetical protein